MYRRPPPTPEEYQEALDAIEIEVPDHDQRYDPDGDLIRDSSMFSDGVTDPADAAVDAPQPVEEDFEPAAALPPPPSKAHTDQLTEFQGWVMKNMSGGTGRAIENRKIFIKMLDEYTEAFGDDGKFQSFKDLIIMKPYMEWKDGIYTILNFKDSSDPLHLQLKTFMDSVDTVIAKRKADNEMHRDGGSTPHSGGGKKYKRKSKKKKYSKRKKSKRRRKSKKRRKSSKRRKYTKKRR